MSHTTDAADAFRRPLNLTAPTELLALLRRYSVRPRKRLGQNFLVDAHVLANIVSAAQLSSQDQVLEIGAGVGTVTRALARTAKRVTTIELDQHLEPILHETLDEFSNVELVIADVLLLSLPELLTGDPWKIVANLPYYVTTPILTRLLELNQYISLIVIMVQREVADRLRAAPGGKAYGSLSILVQWRCEIEHINQVSRNCFLPAPQVDSSLLRLRMRTSPPVAVQDEAHFFRVVHAAFGQRRKTLLNALTGVAELDIGKAQVTASLQAAGIDPRRRGESLSLAEFAALSDALQRKEQPAV